jgi:hypothetical protein
MPAQACLRCACLYYSAMKLLLSVMVYLLLAALLAWGILLMMHGKPWLLIGSVVAYVVGVAKIGCLSH